MIQQHSLHQCLRQILAVLEAERQAIAGLDLDAITLAARDKSKLCEQIDTIDTVELDEECQAMLMAARNGNETNRQMRNLVAANIQARLDMFTGSPKIYGSKRYAEVRA